MKNKKKIIIPLLLLLLTTVVVLTPMAVNALNNNRRLTSKSYWDYDEREKVKLTSLQVANIICDLDNIGVTATPISDNDISIAELNQRSENAVRAVFSQNQKLADYFCNYIQDNPNTFYRESILTVMDNRPVALVIANISYRDDDAFFEIVYEEKTNTVISFYYYSDEPADEWTPDAAYLPSYDDFAEATDAYAQKIGISPAYYETEMTYSVMYFHFNKDGEIDKYEYET